MSKNSYKKLIKTLNDRFKIDYIGFKRSKMPHCDHKSSGNNMIKQFSKTRCEQPRAADTDQYGGPVFTTSRF